MDETVADSCAVPSDTIGCRVQRLSRLHYALLSGGLTTLGLYPGQETVLTALWESGPVTQTQLADRIGVDTSTVCRSLQRLERGQLVARTASDTDRRTTVVQATDHAELVREGLAAVYEHNERVLVAGLDDAEIAQLASLLDKIINNLVARQSERTAPVHPGPTPPRT